MDLETIGIDRLFIADQQVPNWIAETLTRILFEHRQEIRNTIFELSETGLNFEPEVVIPLVDDDLHDVGEYPPNPGEGDADQLSNYLKDGLDKLFGKHRKLDALFQQASSSLDHGSFLAFSEAYKSAREIVEREIEYKQRKFSSL